MLPRVGGVKQYRQITVINACLKWSTDDSMSLKIEE